MKIKPDLSSNEWFLDKNFWEDYAFLLFDQNRWAEVPSTVEKILKLAEIKKAEPVLDLCCGPGRHALAIGQMGYPVVGVDITEPYINAARESALSMGLSNTEFITDDARTWSRPGYFKLALNLFTSFGYFNNIEDDRLMLKRLFENLAPNGVLIMELVGKEIAARDFIDGEWFEKDGKTVLTQFEIIGPWEALKHRWIIIDGQKRIDRSWTQRLYSAMELKSMLESVGFSKIEVFGSFDKGQYSQSAESLVIKAVKKL